MREEPLVIMYNYGFNYCTYILLTKRKKERERRKKRNKVSIKELIENVK